MAHGFPRLPAHVLQTLNYGMSAEDRALHGRCRRGLARTTRCKRAVRSVPDDRVDRVPPDDHHPGRFSGVRLGGAPRLEQLLREGGPGSHRPIQAVTKGSGRRARARTMERYTPLKGDLPAPSSPVPESAAALPVTDAFGVMGLVSRNGRDAVVARPGSTRRCTPRVRSPRRP